jgi:hypothetical protein
LKDGNFIETLQKLRDELIYDYHVNHHPKYTAHMIHEWMCGEANSALHNKVCEDSKDPEEHSDTPRLLEGAISRLIRKLEIPKGISRHCPVHKPQNMAVKERIAGSTKGNFNADYALVYAKNHDEMKKGDDSLQGMAFDKLCLQQSVFVALSDDAKVQVEKKAIEEILPPTIMSYAKVPSLKNKAFGDPIHYGRSM